MFNFSGTSMFQSLSMIKKKYNSCKWSEGNYCMISKGMQRK